MPLSKALKVKSKIFELSIIFGESVMISVTFFKYVNFFVKFHFTLRVKNFYSYISDPCIYGVHSNFENAIFTRRNERI